MAPTAREVSRADVPKPAASSDPFEIIRGLAKSAYEGDGRAQFTVARELDKCELTLSVVRKSGDPEAAIWGFANWTQAMKEWSIAEYRRCIRLVKEDPFADLPPRAGGYTFRYWRERSAEAGYPLAVAERSLAGLAAPLPGLPANPKTRANALGELTQAAVSGDPDVALTIGFRQFHSDNEVRFTSSAAWMLAACRLGADCSSSSNVVPFHMCYDPDFPNCATDSNVEQMVSLALGPAKHADAYSQSQAIEEALRSRDDAALKPLLERLTN
ncbi:MAG TPA: hypothetical protein VIV63_14280 [Steroidobacteraceae bacterium]